MSAVADLDLSVLDTLEFTPACEFKRNETACEKDAEFVCTCKGCGKSVFVCTEHLGWLKEVLAAYGGLQCAACGKVTRIFDEGVEVQPI